jgi:hypothetical protein
MSEFRTLLAEIVSTRRDTPFAECAEKRAIRVGREVAQGRDMQKHSGMGETAATQGGGMFATQGGGMF